MKNVFVILVILLFGIFSIANAENINLGKSDKDFSYSFTFDPSLKVGQAFLTWDRAFSLDFSPVHYTYIFKKIESQVIFYIFESNDPQYQDRYLIQYDGKFYPISILPLSSLAIAEAVYP